MGNVAYDAMMFARHAHAGQVRKYTGNPYHDHLAEVAGIVATVDASVPTTAVAWLHDVVEDTSFTAVDIRRMFDPIITDGVLWLSDVEPGNRAERKRLSRERLARAPAWIQTIKCADLISNTSSIVKHDPKFAVVYLEEMRQLLGVLTKADRRLWELAWNLANVE